MTGVELMTAPSGWRRTKLMRPDASNAFRYGLSRLALPLVNVTTVPFGSTVKMLRQLAVGSSQEAAVGVFATQSAVPSCVNLKPEGLAASATGW